MSVYIRCLPEVSTLAHVSPDKLSQVKGLFSCFRCLPSSSPAPSKRFGSGRHGVEHVTSAAPWERISCATIQKFSYGPLF